MNLNMHSCELDDLKKVCPHCGKKHEEKFSSDFDFHTHYIIATCSNCGYKLFIRDSIMTSGIEVNECSILEKTEDNVTEINDENCDISDKFKL